MSNLPTFSIRELLDAGVHFGHKTMRWNPNMAPYLYGIRDNTHIIDLQQTVPLLHQALEIVRDVVKNNGRLLFVATKRQASEIVKEAAKRCGQYYVNHRWLGGMMTNWGTISKQINTMNDIEAKLAENDNEESTKVRLTKKEKLELSRHYGKLSNSLGGIRNMGGRPDLLFVIDTNKESLAVLEARKLNIPIIAILDSNSNPEHIDYPVPGNDDATRAIRLYCNLVADSALIGIQESLAAAGADIGEAADIDEMKKELEKTKEIKRSPKKTTTTFTKKKVPAIVTTKKVAVKEESEASSSEESNEQE